LVTTTDSAQAPPTAGGPVALQTAERVGARARAAVLAERRAWLILWVAFATFCALVFAAVKFGVDYISTAEIDQSAHITASRGQVVFTLPGSTDKTLLGTRNELAVGTILALDRSSPSSADLQFFDDSKITVLGGASVELTRMELGRFINQHSLVLTQSSGPIRYATGGPMEVVVPNGLVQLTAHGDYTIWIDGETTRVLVYGGEARVAASGTTVTVADGRLAEIDAQHQVHPPVPRQTQLLANSDFAQHDQNWEPLDVLNTNVDVNGSRFWVPGPSDGPPSTALRVVRQSLKAEHGETILFQKLDRDVSGFRHLWLQAMVRVDFADLSGGGTLNSEYPMMMRIKYENPVEGTRPDWSIGFYYSNQDGRTIPDWLGKQWPQSEWKAYEVDLMQTEASAVPFRLLEFAVMGQGHSYDARIANISLFGD
jgi:hypothetical protein